MLRIPVVGEDGPGGGVDLVVVFGVAAGIVEFHVVDLAPVVPLQLGPDEGDLSGGEPRMVQGNLPGPVGGDAVLVCALGGERTGLRGGGTRGGGAGDDGAGEGVDVILIALAAGGEVHGVEVRAVAPVQAGGGEDGGGLRHAGVLQGDGLGGVQADVVGLAGGLAAGGQGEGEQGGAAHGAEGFPCLFHERVAPFCSSCWLYATRAT